MRAACAAVLAGGLSRRFGSDKALASLRGEPLIAHALRGVRGFAQVLVVAKQPAKYAAFAAAGAAGSDLAAPQAGAPARVELVEDRWALQTPLAGLAAALAASRYELVFACAADLPYAADPALLDALFDAIADRHCAVPESGGAVQPLCALWRRDPCLRVAEELLAGPRAVGPRALLPLLYTRTLAWADEVPFLDADTPEALALLARR